MRQETPGHRQGKGPLPLFHSSKTPRLNKFILKVILCLFTVVLHLFVVILCLIVVSLHLCSPFLVISFLQISLFLVVWSFLLSLCMFVVILYLLWSCCFSLSLFCIYLVSFCDNFASIVLDPFLVFLLFCNSVCCCLFCLL